MVWLIAGLPATAVVAGLTTYFIAAHEPDSLVRADYRKEGFAVVEKTTAADARAAQLGIVARLTMRGEHLELSLKSLMPTLPERLGLTVIHPTMASQDLHVDLVRAAPGVYAARLPGLGEGKRILVLEPDDRAWRVSGQWMAPFSGLTELAANGTKNPAPTNPSTHP